MVVIVIGLFSLSSSKRADYIAATYLPAALLAAWWFYRSSWFSAIGAAWIACSAAALTLTAMTFVNHRETAAPVRGFGDSIVRFERHVNRYTSQSPLPLVLFMTGESHVQAMLGRSEPESADAVLTMIARGRPFLLLAGRGPEAQGRFESWLRRQRLGVKAIPIIASDDLPYDHGWRGKLTLFEIKPHETGPATAAAASQPEQ